MGTRNVVKGLVRLLMLALPVLFALAPVAAAAGGGGAHP